MNKILSILLLVFPLSFLYPENIPEIYSQKIAELNNRLISLGAPDEWLSENLSNENFKIYYDLQKYFSNMKEKRVDRNEKDWEWFKNHFGLDLKIKMGEKFIKENSDVLIKVEEKNGIDYEMICAIIGMESNYAMQSQKGTFFTFNVFVTQYILFENREKIAADQLINLYRFCEKSNKSVFYFIGSFAGACGWAQFIPSSLVNFFVDSNGIDSDMDPYSLDDCLFSIENYLFKNGLNGNNISDYQSKYNSIYSYNRSATYVKSILYIYDGLKN